MQCLIVDDDAMARAVVEQLVEQHDALNLVASCESAVAAANVLRRQPVDLVFLDVEMPDMTGLELAQSLAVRPQIIMVTGKEEYALDAFDVEVTDFLLKPIAPARFLKAVDRALRRHAQAAQSAAPPSPDDGRVFIKVDGRLVQLDLADVRWIEAQADYMRIHTETDKYLIHGTMKSMEAKLPADEFIRVHRSYIIRIDRIRDIQESTIVIDRQVIPIGASYRERLLKRLNTL